MICRAKASLRLGESYWGIKHLVWSVADQPSTLQLAPLMEAAARSCSARCGLTFEQGDPREAQLILSVGAGPRHDFDGRGNVLGWFQLPGPRQIRGSCFGRLDLADFDQLPYTAEPLPVITHEAFGHGVGLPHLPGPALLQDTYDERIQDYTTTDTQALQYLYGPPSGERPLDPNDQSQMSDMIARVREEAAAAVREVFGKATDDVIRRILG